MLGKLLINRAHVHLPKRARASYVMPNNEHVPAAFCRLLFVRDCYSLFCTKLHEGSSTKSGVLTGRPGMGKSMFGIYFVIRKFLEVLLDESEQQERFKLIYIVGTKMTKIEFPASELLGEDSSK